MILEIESHYSIIRLQHKNLIDEIQLEIDELKANYPLAPDDCWIVRFRAKGKGGASLVLQVAID